MKKQSSDDLADRIAALPSIVQSVMRTPLLVSGNKRARLKTRGAETVDTAPFRLGIDNVRDLHISLSARLGRLMRRIRKEDKQQWIASIIDMRPSLSDGLTRIKRDFALEIAAALLLAAAKTGDRALLVELAESGDSSGHAFTMNSPQAIVAKVLELHERAHRAPQAIGIAESLKAVSLAIPARSNVFVISDFIFPPADKHDAKKPLAEQSAYRSVRAELDLLSARNEIGLVAIHDVRDFSIPEAQWQLYGSSSKTPVIVDGFGPACEATLKKLRDERIAWFKELERDLGIDYCLLETETEFDYVSELIVFLAARQGV